MTKKNKKMLLIASIIAALLAIGAGTVVYMLQRQTPNQSSPSNTNICKTIAGSEVCTEDYVGLTEAMAIEKAEVAGVRHQVVERDGAQILTNANIDRDRLSFTVVDNIVTKAEFK